MPRLTNKVAIVTGSSRGIGAAIAQRLAADGAKVVVNYAKSRDAADRIVKDIKSAGGDAIAIGGDLSDPATPQVLVDGTIAAFKKIDILVNNAGVADLGNPLETVSAAHYAKHFDLNVRGLLLMTQAAAAKMQDNGRIINITSGIVKMRVAGAGVYSATKAAVEALTRCHSSELGKRGITVNSVAPGTTDTDMLRGSLPAEAVQAMISQTTLGRLGTPQDLADVVAFVASDEARWITGEVIPANGGLG